LSFSNPKGIIAKEITLAEGFSLDSLLTRGAIAAPHFPAKLATNNIVDCPVKQDLIFASEPIPSERIFWLDGFSHG
jgi:hypothetical protein